MHMPVLVYLAVAALIALVGFIIAQVVPGAGVPFVIFASLIWTGYSACRAQDRAR